MNDQTDIPLLIVPSYVPCQNGRRLSHLHPTHNNTSIYTSEFTLACTPNIHTQPTTDLYILHDHIHQTADNISRKIILQNKCNANEEDDKAQSPRIVRAGSRNDTSHKGYWNTVDIGFMQWYCERRMDSIGLEIKCGTANLQRQRRPYGVWISHTHTHTYHLTALFPGLPG